MNSIETNILNRVWELREIGKSRKFVGALTIELLRKEFMRLGLNVSNRDAFVEGIPNELDLLVLKTKAQAQENLLYNPADVLAVLEIKFRGSYGMKSIERVRKVFDSVKALNKNIDCLYIAISDNRNYRNRVTKANLGYDYFELLTRDCSLERALRDNRLTLTGDWQRLVSRLKGER